MPDLDLIAAERHLPSRSDRHRHRERRRRRGRRAGVLLVALVVVVVGALAAVTVLRPVYRAITASDDFEGNGRGSVTVVIEEGSSGKAIGRALQKAGVVKSVGAFVDAAAEEPRAASLQPGTYQLRERMSGAAALALLLRPESRLTERVTVPEGLRVTQVLAELSKVTGRPAAEYTAALAQPESLGLPASAKGNAEGWLFPATYDFEPGSTPVQQLAMMVGRAKQELEALGVTEAEAGRVLTVASIAEVEAARREDYGKVARVIENRLAKGMKLQMDSTVHYVVGKPGKVTTTAQERATRSPYNTYAVTGLPPGPVSNPGRAAIEGALEPPAGSWLFFVSVNPSTGETRFATTEVEHQRNVEAFRAWCRSNAGSC